MYILRDYQQEAVDRGLGFFKNKSKENGIIVAPVGAGKSLIISNLAKELDGDVLVFQPTKEILAQNYEKYISYGEEASIFSASMGVKDIGKVTFATIGSVINKKELFEHFDYILVDECHLVNAKGGMYNNFIKFNRNKVLGLTASPYRLSTDGFGGSILKFLTRTRPRIFSRLIHYTQIKELSDRSYWSPIHYFRAEFDSTKLKVNSTGAEYTDKSILELFREYDFSRRVLRSVEKLMELGCKNILVFTKFVEEAENLVLNLGSEAAVVSAKTPKDERDQIISDFRKGKIRVVANVGVLTLGFDYPELDTVVLARPTMSLTLYYQMIGRCVRPYFSKEKAYVLDMCENWKRFGKVENLWLTADKKDLWYYKDLESGRQLTNVYFT